ncbi:MAG: hypothetical protein QW365_08905 [Candidatus Nezhaarchaeales archaeon]
MVAETGAIRLVPEVPKRLHFVDHAWLKKRIKDPETGWEKTVNALTFRVDMEDGIRVDKVFSILSAKLQSLFMPYLEGKAYTKYIFVIIQHGAGYTAEWEVRTQPWLTV